MDALPPLVERAEALAARLGFERPPSREVGRLLHLLAAQRDRARVGEIGTGCGVGTAWLASALPPGVPLVTAVADPSRAAEVARLLADDPDVRVLIGDWREVTPEEAPFDLLFWEGGGKQRPDDDGERVLGLLAPGGTSVLDDLTPGRAADSDPVRLYWLSHPDLAAAELAVAADAALVAAVRVR